MYVQSHLLDYHRFIRFQIELAISTQVAVSEIRDDVSKIREEIGGQVRSVRVRWVYLVDEGMLMIV